MSCGFLSPKQLFRLMTKRRVPLLPNGVVPKGGASALQRSVSEHEQLRSRQNLYNDGGHSFPAVVWLETQSLRLQHRAQVAYTTI
ncbi:hypothetical protein A33O_14766 [Nitratireductor aquibiodomus RA22]|uniref:Uncharacterized protein n=1 Tax=Nitratireductor aquibiodomus RA22 TaxID=1189611 RepID=I5BV58_9HYPH|nr:hypothetical protein A33O_14766 [Nitratireductor aquibiodomus RA22]